MMIQSDRRSERSDHAKLHGRVRRVLLMRVRRQ